MKKLSGITALVFLFCFNVKAINITIIESNQTIPGHVMDLKWDSLLTALGYNSAIFPQTALDNNSFFSTTDVLIVSSGVIALPPNRVNTIKQFLLQGGDVYLQAEYLATYSADSAFELLVNSLGGGFSWTGTISGTLAPMNINGTFATTPNPVSPLPYFWYGCAGDSCSNIEAFLEYQGNNFGFAFCSPTPSIGRLITTSDQDWIRVATANDCLLMENIFYRLIDTSFTCTGTVYPYINLGNDTTICPGDTLTLNPGSGFTSYMWNTGSTNSTLIATIGTYWVTVTTPCNTYIDTIHINSCTGIGETENQNLQFDIFPDPNDGHFNIQFYNSSHLNLKTVVKIYDALGINVFQNTIPPSSGSAKAEIELNVPAGFYFLELNSGNKSARKKFVIEEN